MLPYREIDQSGVAFTALGAGVPLLLSDVGGFPEIAATGAARTVPAGDAGALREALRRAARRPGGARARWPSARAPRPRGEYAWEGSRAARSTLYEALLGGNRAGDEDGALEIVFWVCAGLIVWTQVGYAARARGCSRACSARDRRAPAGARDGRARSPPSLSLIVAAHDEEAVIAEKVRNALRSTTRASASR